MRKRVVVTGMGIVSPIGNDIETFWEHAVSGVNGISPITDFDVSDFDSKIGGIVKDFELPGIDKKNLRRMEKFVQFALFASQEAIRKSAIDLSKEDRTRIGVVIGVGIGSLRVIEEQYEILLKSGPSRVSPFLIPLLIPNMAAGQVAIHFGLRGTNFATVSACASGGHALAASLDLLRSGAVDVMITGGAESCITPLSLAGFCSMKALSKRNNEPDKASRPFDRMRDGFVIGEGAGIVVLETLEHAKKRNAPKIDVEFINAGMSCDAYHVAAPDPEGEGAFLCMKNALENTDISVDNVQYINAHGTSTFLNDKAETAAIKRLFGKRAYDIPVTSIKSMVGHLLGAAGGVEFITTALVISKGILPPTRNYEVPDPDCDLDYVPNVSREKDVSTAISNSFGFGGHNVSLVMKKFQE